MTIVLPTSFYLRQDERCPYKAARHISMTHNGLYLAVRPTSEAPYLHNGAR